MGAGVKQVDNVNLSKGGNMSTIGLPKWFKPQEQTKPRHQLRRAPAVVRQAIPSDAPASMPPVDQAAASLARATNGVVANLSPDDLEPIALWLSSDQSEDCEIPF
jgi:hypothetical protein